MSIASTSISQSGRDLVTNARLTAQGMRTLGISNATIAASTPRTITQALAGTVAGTSTISPNLKSLFVMPTTGAVINIGIGSTTQLDGTWPVLPAAGIELPLTSSGTTGLTVFCSSQATLTVYQRG